MMMMRVRDVEMECCSTDSRRSCYVDSKVATVTSVARPSQPPQNQPRQPPLLPPQRLQLVRERSSRHHLAQARRRRVIQRKIQRTTALTRITWTYPIAQ